MPPRLENYALRKYENDYGLSSMINNSTNVLNSKREFVVNVKLMP